MTELYTLIGYKKVEGKYVAVLQENWTRSTIVFNYQNLQARLKNLQLGGWPHDVTKAALENFPLEEEIEMEHGWSCSKCSTKVPGPYALCPNCGYEPERRLSSTDIIPPKEGKFETIKHKVQHVLQAQQSRLHSCHWPGCHIQVPPAMWGCTRHWYMLPKTIRTQIWREYSIGQEERLDPSGEYISAATQAQKWIREHYPCP